MDKTHILLGVNSLIDWKIKHLIYEFGLTGYGAFRMIIEIMAVQKNHKINLKGLSEILLPFFQGQEITYSAEDGIGGYKNESGQFISIEDVGCYEVSKFKIEEMIDFMIEIGLFNSKNGRIWIDSLSEQLNKKTN